MVGLLLTLPCLLTFSWKSFHYEPLVKQTARLMFLTRFFEASFRTVSNADTLSVMQDTRSSLHEYICRVSGSPVLIIFFAVLTLYALLGDEFRAWACPKSADAAFHWITGFCLVMFFLEIGELLSHFFFSNLLKNVATCRYAYTCV